MSTKILIVEDEPLVAADIAGFLEHANFSVSGIAYDAEMALGHMEKSLPDCVLLDINLGNGLDGTELAEKINELYKIPFVYLTSHADRGTIERVKQTRPAGYLLKPFDENDLLTSLEIAVFNHMNNKKNKASELSIDYVNRYIPSPLTEREFEILNLVKQGQTNKEIGEAIHLSVNTIKTHLQRIYDKLDVKNRAEIMFKLMSLMEV